MCGLLSTEVHELVRGGLRLEEVPADHPLAGPLHLLRRVSCAEDLDGQIGDQIRIVPSSNARVNACPGTDLLKSSALIMTFVSKT